MGTLEADWIDVHISLRECADMVLFPDQGCKRKNF